MEVRFSNVIFKEMFFEDFFFINCNFTNCNFINCKGLNPANFYSAAIDDKTVLPAGVSAEKVADLNIIDIINAIDRLNNRKGNKDFMKEILLRAIKDIKSVHALYSASENNPDMQVNIRKTAHDLAFYKSYNDTLTLDCSDDDKWRIICCLFSDKILPEIIYDAGIMNEVIKSMPLYIKTRFGPAGLFRGCRKMSTEGR